MLLGVAACACGGSQQERDVFPPGTDLEAVLSLYVMMSSIELSTEDVARIAATLANGGVQPYTGDRIFGAVNVRNCLALMATCGMYQYSGEWAFSVGLPAKSAVNGTIMVVIPNVMVRLFPGNAPVAAMRPRTRGSHLLSLCVCVRALLPSRACACIRRWWTRSTTRSAAWTSSSAWCRSTRFTHTSPGPPVRGWPPCAHTWPQARPI